MIDDRDEPEGVVFEAYLNTLNAAMLRGDVSATEALEHLEATYRVTADVAPTEIRLIYSPLDR